MDIIFIVVILVLICIALAVAAGWVIFEFKTIKKELDELNKNKTRELRILKKELDELYKANTILIDIVMVKKKG